MTGSEKGKEIPIVTISLFFYIAAAQALLLSVAFYLKEEKLLSNRIQCAWMAVMALDLWYRGVMRNDEFVMNYPWIILLSGFPIVHGPFLYLYIKSITTQSQMKRSDYLHFFGYIIFRAFFFPMNFWSNEEFLVLVEQLRSDTPPLYRYLDMFITAHGFLYVFMTYLHLRAHRRHVKEYYSNEGRHALKMMRTVVGLNLFAWITVFIHTFFPSEILRPFTFLTYFFASLFVFVVAYYALTHPRVFVEQWQQLHPPEAAPVGSAKYAKTALKEERADEIKSRLLEYMEEKPWVEPELSIQDISAAIGYPIYQVSQVINNHFETNLYSFINRYRVEEVKGALKDPELRAYPILQVAFQSGFNSKSTFNAVFKEFTGVTPSEYRSSSPS